MNLFVQFRAIPFHICTLLTAMLMYSMPTLAGTVFYDFAAPADLDGGFSATGFIEIDDADAVDEVPGATLDEVVSSWGFRWFNGEDDFSVTSLETGLYGADTEYLVFNESSDLVAWSLCTEGCAVKTTPDQPALFAAVRNPIDDDAPRADREGEWLGTADLPAADCLVRPAGRCGEVGGTGGLWTRRAAVAAPEPAVSGLLALGLLAVGATKRRKC